MAQVSYGTITINDITDISDIYLQYCMVADNVTANNISENSWFILSSDTTVQNKHYYAFNSSDNQYHIVACIGTENPTSLGWYEDKPYPIWQSGNQIWIREVRIKEGIDLPEYGTPYLDTAVNQINKDLVAYLDTQGLNIEALNSKIRFMWTNLTPHSQGDPSWVNPNYPAGTYAASGKYNSSLNKYTIDYENSDTYGYNSFLNHNSLNLRYDAINMTQLSTAALTFYRPTTINNQLVQGDRGLVINADGLDILSISNYKLSDDTIVDPTKIYYSKNSNTYTRISTPSGNPHTNNYYEHDIDAKLDANGLILKKGGIQAGTAGQSGFIYLSTENYGSNLTINSHQASNWREIIGTKFGVDADGNLYASNADISGKITVGSGSNVYTKTEANGAFDALGAANTAEANASYSIEIKVTDIDYTNNSATLVAVPYYQGSTTLPTLSSGAYSYRWYKGTTALSNTNTNPTISGATTTTLVLGNGSDLDAIYVCVISKP